MTKYFWIYIFAFIVMGNFSCSTASDDNPIVDEPEDNVEDPSLYFPPITGNTWETISPSELNWDQDKLNDLYDYLEEKDTRGFIMLKDGRIAVERYFNGHDQNAIWTWFSAVKSLTATAIGVAQDQGVIDITNKTSEYLGDGWSSLTQEQQDAILVKHHLSMSTGLEEHIMNPIAWACTAPFCFTYSAPANTRWAYHQGAFTALQNMISQNSGMDFKDYFRTNILDRIGIAGSWNTVLSINIFSSNTRSMARFGLLSLNKGTWDEDMIVNESYFDDMVNTSQNINESYGYLWWLNGKETFMIPGNQEVFEGPLIPNAPDDLFAALGANDQKIYVIPSLNMVVVRCGDSAGNEQLASSSFDNELWEKINEVIN